MTITDYLLPAAVIGFLSWRFISYRIARGRIPDLLREGAQVVDVRSEAEYAGGHPAASLNIPLPDIRARAKELDPNRWVIVCCASGSRSGMARRVLLGQGFKHVLNAGPWRNLP